MPTARDIALIFLSLEALVIALVPLAIFSGLAYGVYRLHRLAKEGLRKAQAYAQLANDTVERVSKKVAQPVIEAHAAGSQTTAMLRKMTRRRSDE